MAERRTISRRSLFGLGLGLSLTAVLGPDDLFAEESSTKILTTSVRIDSFDERERGYVEKVFKTPACEVPEFLPAHRVGYIYSRVAGISSEIQSAALKQDEDGMKTPETPNLGIATLEHPLDLYPTVLVYGHSRWNGEEQEFAKITRLNIGDMVFVYQPNLSGRFVEFGFAVDRIRISSTEILPKADSLTLTLQASAVYDGEDWFVDKDEALAKADTNEFDGIWGNYYVDAKPVRVRVPVLSQNLNSSFPNCWS